MWGVEGSDVDNDKRNYQFWKRQQESDIEFEGSFWSKIDEMVKWVYIPTS